MYMCMYMNDDAYKNNRIEVMSSICMRMSTYLYNYMCVSTYIYTLIYTHAYIYTNTYAYAYVYVYAYVCAYAYVCDRRRLPKQMY